MYGNYEKSFKGILVIFCMFLVFTCSIQAQEKKEPKQTPLPVIMVNPEIDNVEPFGYLAKPATCLSVIGAPDGTQVCFDGSLYTASSELVFFYGEPLKPIMARAKTLLEGWIPVIRYSVQDGDVEYRIEAFASMLTPGDLLSPMINFVRVEMENKGKKEVKAVFAAGTRFTGEDHRFRYRKPDSFSPAWMYEMTEGELIRDGKMILCYPKGGERLATPDAPYKSRFKGSEFFITDRAEVGLVKYAPTLSPGKKYSLIFKHPFLAVPVSEKENIETVKQADYEQYRTETIEAWKAEMAKGAQLSIPEEKVINAHRANLMYTWMAITLRDGNWMQCVNKFQYHRFWLRDAAYIIHNHDVWGHHELAEKVLENYPSYQNEEGLFSSNKGQLDGFGQALFALGQHAIFKGDGGYGEKIFPYFAPAVSWLKKARATDPFHLMPKTDARDNEHIDGHYTGHNFWALLGLRTAARIALITGREKEAKTFLAEYDDLYNAFMKRLKEVAGENGYIPPGLDVEGGQDWGNLIGLYPTEVLDPKDARITTTLEKMHREKFQEGVMTYSGHLHQYLTVKEAQNHVARGEQEQALKDFYGILVHTGSCHEMFEWRALPWADRDVGRNFSPHGWGAAMFNLMLRNMLILEWGGKGGLAPREMHLFSVLSPEWVVPGEEISLKNAPTELGLLSLVLKCAEKGADITFEKKFHTPPEKFVLHIPYFVDLIEFKTDAKESKREGGRIILSPDATSVNLTWKKKEVEPLNFEKAVKEFKDEYAKRYKKYMDEGNTPIVVEAPKTLSREEREIEYKTLYSPGVQGIAYKKPVKASGPFAKGHEPQLAVDGNIKDPKDGSTWWDAQPPLPQWLEIDLEKIYDIGAIQPFPYWDGNRYYQYTVETSIDGKEWAKVVDMSANKKPSTAKGDYHKIAPQKARYVRVNMLYNSANPSAHLVEVRIYEAK